MPDPMKAPISKKRRPAPGWKRLLDRINAAPTPWLWLLATLLLYGSVGLVLASFPVPYWLWTLALAGTFLQAVVLLGSQAQQRLRRPLQLLLGFLGVLGAGALAAALSIALNHAGSDDLDQVELQNLVLEVALLSLLALLLAGLSAAVTAHTGDRLIASFRRVQASLILAATALLGLGMGGAMGLLSALR